MEHDTLAFMNLYRVFGYIQAQAWNALPQAGSKQISTLNVRQIKAMMVVHLRDMEGKAPLTLSQLGDSLGLRKAAMSLLVSDLAEKKLLCRAVDRENRRFIRITLGIKGRRLGDAITSQAAIHIAEIFGTLTEDERKNFTMIADKIYASYSHKVEGAE